MDVRSFPFGYCLFVLKTRRLAFSHGTESIRTTRFPNLYNKTTLIELTRYQQSTTTINTLPTSSKLITMASTLAFPQQQQQAQALPIQSVSASNIDNSLLSALATYVTTGSHARSTTEQEIQELASAVVAKPGGRAHLESLIQFDSCPDHQVWKNQANASGKINITKTNLTIALELSLLS
jgi:hypothetical protein